MFHEFDPYAKLEELYLRSMSQERDCDELGEKLAQACQLMEQMAEQVRHLTNAIVGLQQMNKILHDRITRLEFKEHD
jgi:uncharacterized coiled-coil protein SlyX